MAPGKGITKGKGKAPKGRKGDDKTKEKEFPAEVHDRKTYAAVASGVASLQAGLEELKATNEALKQFIRQHDGSKTRQETRGSYDQCASNETSFEDTSSSEDDEECQPDFMNPKAVAQAKKDRRWGHNQRMRRDRSHPYLQHHRRPVLQRRAKLAALEEDIKPAAEELVDISGDTLDEELLRCSEDHNVCPCGKRYSNFTLLVIHKLTCGKEIKPEDEVAATDLNEELEDPTYWPGVNM